MIIDTLDNASRYFMLHPSMEQAFDFLDDVTADSFPEGKNEIVGDHLFGNGMVRDTKGYDESIWESHRKYLDIHFLAEGDEKIYFAAEEDMKEVKSYDAEKDITVFEGKGLEIFVPKNGFVIFFPGEIHKALVHGEKPNTVKKMVLKLGIE
jgi:biofilm protein TabA